MSRSFDTVTVLCVCLAMPPGVASAQQPRTQSAKSVVLRAAVPPATGVRAVRPAPPPMQPAAKADADKDNASDGDRFRYDSCGCSGG